MKRLKKINDLIITKTQDGMQSELSASEGAKWIKRLLDSEATGSQQQIVQQLGVWLGLACPLWSFSFSEAAQERTLSCQASSGQKSRGFNSFFQVLST